MASISEVDCWCSHTIVCLVFVLFLVVCSIPLLKTNMTWWSIKVVEILCRHYTLHSGSHQFILFTHKDLDTSESGFSSEDIYTTARNSPHTWYVLKSSDLCTWTWVILIIKPTMHIPRLGAQAVTHPENHAHLCCLTSMIEASHTLTLSCPTG